MSEQRNPFGGRLLLIGCGSVSRCFQPLLLQHVDMDFRKLTILDFEDRADTVPETLAAGATYDRHRITPDNLAQTLAQRVGPDDIVVDLAWDIDTAAIVQWCHDHDVRYINTSVEVWDPYGDLTISPQEKTLYARHMRLRALARTWRRRGPTIVVEHGANPGLVSHWTKVALIDIATAMLGEPPRPAATELVEARRSRLEEALQAEDFSRLAMETGTKTIHISERDTQVSDRPKEVGEFVNTWSIEGFYEEGIATAEMGWGTHERTLPANAFTHEEGPCNQICLARPGVTTLVRSWVPLGGEIIGMVVRHGESFTISDHLTVWAGDEAVYRPTVHYAYLPADVAVVSWLECRMQGYKLQDNQRIMGDEITGGIDELGVLLLGHDLTGWWTGSQLGIDEARKLAPHQNATTLQVAASVLGALIWTLNHPKEGLCVPDDLDHREVLAVANQYLGPCPSIQTDWTPLLNRVDPFEGYGRPRPRDEDVWQFASFLAP
jgi:homospermidine synthase